MLDAAAGPTPPINLTSIDLVRLRDAIQLALLTAATPALFTIADVDEATLVQTGSKAQLQLVFKQGATVDVAAITLAINAAVASESLDVPPVVTSKGDSISVQIKDPAIALNGAGKEPDDTSSLDKSSTISGGTVGAIVLMLLLAIGAVLWWIRCDRAKEAIVLTQIAMDELGYDGAAYGMINNPMAGRTAAAAAAVADADPPPEVPLVANPMYALDRDGGALPTEVPLIANVIYAGEGGPRATATTTPVDGSYSGYAPPETAFRRALDVNNTATAANQSNSTIYAVPAEGGDTLLLAANMHTATAVAAGTVVYDLSSGGEAASVAHDDMAGGAGRCTRQSLTSGTCKNTALRGGGGLFCKGHTCPQCDAGKSSSDVGCPAHSNAAPTGSSNSTTVYAVPADDAGADSDGDRANNAGVHYFAVSVPVEATVPTNNGVYSDGDAVPAYDPSAYC